MDKVTVFVSHITEEAPLAKLLKTELVQDFLGLLDVFVSSDTESIAAGDKWLPSIESALQRASVQLVLCSPVSVRRPWINFEAGASWMRGIPVIPVCHTDLEPSDLPMPLAALQGVRASDASGLNQIYRLIANIMGARQPRIDTAKIIESIRGFEDIYRTQIPVSAASEIDQNRLALQRMKDLLEEPKFRYRTIDKLAAAAAMSASEAIDLLRTDKDVIFSKKESGEPIARLRWR